MSYPHDRPRFTTHSIAIWCPCCLTHQRLFAFGTYVCAECYVDYMEGDARRLRADTRGGVLAKALLSLPRSVMLPHPWTGGPERYRPYLEPRDHDQETMWEFGFRTDWGEVFGHSATGRDFLQMIGCLMPLIRRLRLDTEER